MNQKVVGFVTKWLQEAGPFSCNLACFYFCLPDCLSFVNSHGFLLYVYNKDTNLGDDSYPFSSMETAELAQ